MRFGETWSAGVAPEWESQYLDYKQGKSLIHRLEDDKVPLGKFRQHLQLPSPAIAPVNERSPLLTFTHKSRPKNSTSLPGSAIPLGPIKDTTKIDVFFKWLDGQISKVSTFFNEQEDEAVKKYEMLKSELEHLASHKNMLKDSTRLTETPVHVLGNLDLPSLPNALRPKNKRDPRSRLAGDFSHSPISYSHARHLIKTAILEYYQSLQHLRGYRSLNATAMRKINKKFDKTFGCKTVAQHDEEVAQLRFIKSHVLDKLTKDTEDLYADNFEQGNHKFAVEKLQSNPEKYPHNLEVLITGLLLGGSLPLFVLALYSGISRYTEHHDWEMRALLNVWACWLILALMCLLFSLNILVWKKYRVNYVFVFEFNRYNYLDYREYPIMPAGLFFLLSLFAWLTFNVSTSDFNGRYFPCVFIGIAIFVFLFPFKVWFASARRWMQVALVRLIFSGLFDIEFRDFFMGDMFCSLNYTLGNLSFFFCLYATPQWWLDQSRSARCNSSNSHLLGFLNCLPGVWRLLQCLRRFLDTGAVFPHLYNGTKYSMFILCNMFLSLARIHESTKWKVCYILFAALNAIFSSIWDILMDFSLGPQLRPERAFPDWTYYAVMVVDPILRFNWVLYLVFWTQKQQSDKVSFIVAAIELVRRMIWVTFRIENEHCANVAKFRAFKDLHLPYRVSESGDDEENACSTAVEESRPSTAPRRYSGAPGSVGGASGGGRRSLSESFSHSPRIASIIKSITFAHTEDFTRRRPNEDELDDEDES